MHIENDFQEVSVACEVMKILWSKILHARERSRNVYFTYSKGLSKYRNACTVGLCVQKLLHLGVLI